MVRLKHRYLLLEILYPSPAIPANQSSEIPLSLEFHTPTPDSLSPRLLLSHVRYAVSQYFGEYGNGITDDSLKVIYLSSPTSTAILRVTRNHYRLVWAALTFITRLPAPINTPCTISVVHVSGTIRKVEEVAIRRAKDSILRAQGLASGAAEKTLERMLASEANCALDDKMDDD